MSGCLEIIGPRAAQLGSNLVHLRDGRTPENPLVGRSKVRIKFLILGLRLAIIRI